MPEMSTERQRRRGGPLQNLICVSLIGLCCAGHRPLSKEERQRHARHSDTWVQRLLYPLPSDILRQNNEAFQYPYRPDCNSQIQKCGPGYYRDRSGPYLGRCVPCNCNGLSDECEDRTGRCLNCRDNTAGHRCEVCKEGYYGNAVRRTCRVCPCPFSVAANSFARGCVEMNGEIECLCKAGYAGNKCQSCSAGYYGNPEQAGGSCKPCNCNGNGNSCDPRTGVCKNNLEPGDTDTDEQCQECDNCVQTLLQNLEKVEEDLRNIKAQLDNASASASSQERMAKLEKAIAETKVVVDKFSSAVNNEKSRVGQLEQDMVNLTDDINSLGDKTNQSLADANKAAEDVEKTLQRAKDLDSEIKKLLLRIQDLLNQLKQEEGRGDSLPGENLAKMLEDAQRMVTEMQNRNFTSQKTAAEKEYDEAKKLLDYIKANVSKQCDENEAAAERIRRLLKDYNSELTDLDKALKEATDFVKKANAQNDLNAQTLKDLEKRINDLNKERKNVEDKINMAEGELRKTEDLVKNLTDSKKEFEQLAAQLDGAKIDLTKKVNEIATAAAKKDIVEAAEEHAKSLKKLAEELENAVRNATGRSEVRDARNAIEAYKNITEAINAAEAAANEAKNAADDALDNIQTQKLPERAKDLKESSEDLLNDAKVAEKDLTDLAKNITDLTKRLNEANEKKKVLEKDLLDAQKKLNETKTDEVEKMIDEAKRKAASANDTATNTMDKLDALRDELNKMNIVSGNANLTGVLDEVDDSVKNLLKTIPSLNEKISEVENLTLGGTPANNISESIDKLKELIEKARDAANRIAIPMKFKGDGYVELRPPANLDDLKAYTALSLSLQRPESRGDRRRRQALENDKMFVLYLGNKDSSKNYLGLYLISNVLYSVYKLNGKEYEMKSDYISQSPSEPAIFDKVDLNRIYQDAELVLTKDISSTKPQPPQSTTSKGEETKNLLDVSPDDMVFYVGGYPDNFTPPASFGKLKYQGCIEFVSFNDKILSLYNFQKAVNVNPEIPCKRYVPPKDSDFFEGTGYGKVLTNTVQQFLPITMSLSSRSENGLIVFIEAEGDYMTLTIEKGFIFLRSNLLSEPFKLQKKIFPVADWTEMNLVIRDSDKMFIRFGSNPVESVNIIFKSMSATEIYIGGAPDVLRERYGIALKPFKGCVKNFKLQSSYKPFDERVGVSKGCLSDSLVSRKAQFSMGSSLSNILPNFLLDPTVSVSLGFKSTKDQGLLLENRQLANEMKLTLNNGYVNLHFNDKLWKSNKQYKDGKWHYLTVTKTPERTELRIDDEDVGQEQSGTRSVPDTDGSVYLGNGVFEGCISNLYTRRPDKLYRPEDFSYFKSSGDVLQDVCSVDNPVQLISKEDAVTQMINESVPPCTLPKLVQHAYRMGGPVGSLSYSLPLQVLQPRPYFSLDVKTRSADGLLFFAATRGGQSHLALYMSKGRIRLSVGKEREILNREKYNDGKWHSVIFSLEKKKFRLVVDGIRAQDGQLTNAELRLMQQFVSPVYLGSAPESLHRELKLKGLPKQSVSGCVRNFKMNGELMSNSSTNRGVGPCFEGPTQRGVYFAGNGAHVIINETFIMGPTFEVLFNVRPRSQTGLLLHVGASTRTHFVSSVFHFLTVYMLRGEVVAQVNNEKGEFLVSVKPKTSLCDGVFHKISVIKRKNVVQLSVDTVDNYKIGPPSSTTTSTKDPLYIGGIPDTLMQQILPVTSSFVGCIQDMKINENVVSFNRLSSVFGPVNLKECPG